MDLVLTGRDAAGVEVLGYCRTDANSYGQIVLFDGTKWTTLYTTAEKGVFMSVHALANDGGFLVAGWTGSVRVAYYCQP